MLLMVWATLRPAFEGERVFDGPAATFSSTMVFHSPQEGQRPAHLGESAPHDEQNQSDLYFVFAIRLWLFSFVT